MQIQKSGSFPVIPHAAFLGLGILQVLGILIFLVKAFTEFLDFNFVDYFLKVVIPFAIGDLLLVSIIVVAGISSKTSRNPALLVAAAISGFLQFAHAAPAIANYGLSFDFNSFSSASGFLLSSILAATGIFLIPLVVLQLQPGPWIIRSPKGWWRVAIGPLAIIFLLIEDPQRVLSERWILLSVALLLIMAASGLLVNRVAIGAFLGLGIATASSLFSYLALWILKSFEDSAISIPSIIAFILLILGVVSTGIDLPSSPKRNWRLTKALSVTLGCGLALVALVKFSDTGSEDTFISVTPISPPSSVTTTTLFECTISCEQNLSKVIPVESSTPITNAAISAPPSTNSFPATTKPPSITPPPTTISTLPPCGNSSDVYVSVDASAYDRDILVSFQAINNSNGFADVYVQFVVNSVNEEDPGDSWNIQYDFSDYLWPGDSISDQFFNGTPGFIASGAQIISTDIVIFSTGPDGSRVCVGGI